MPMYEKANTPITHKVYQRGINLPSFFDVRKKEIQYICNTIKGLI